MDIIDQLKLMEGGRTGPYPRDKTIREARETIERLRATIRNAEASLMDGAKLCAAKVTSALLCLQDHAEIAKTYMDDAKRIAAEAHEYGAKEK